LACIWK